MNKQRLLKAAEIVGLAPNIYMGRWRTTDCGTECCAFGWIVESDWGKASGLSWNYGLYVDGAPSYRGYTNFNAAKLFFDVSQKEIEYLFAGLQYGAALRGFAITKPEHWAKLCRDFVAEHDDHVELEENREVCLEVS